MQATTFPPSATLGAKLDAIAMHAISGSRHPLIRAKAAEAVKATGGDAWAAFERLYAEYRACGVYLPDPGHDAGEDRIEPAHVTLERCAGDCDDWTVAVLALARSLGFRGSAVTLSSKAEDGTLTPLHIYAQIQRAAGAAVPGDLSEGLSLGADPLPRFTTATVREEWPMEHASDGLGFLGGIISAIGSIIGGNSQKSAARSQQRAAEAQAGALVEQAAASERNSEREAAVGLAAIEASRREATINALLQKRGLDQAADTTRDVLGFLKDMVPVAAAVVVLRAVMPLAERAVGAR